jgi:hypothetical protein
MLNLHAKARRTTTTTTATRQRLIDNNHQREREKIIKNVYTCNDTVATAHGKGTNAEHIKGTQNTTKKLKRETETLMCRV